MKRTRVTITLKEDLLKNIDKLVDGTNIKNRSHAFEFLLGKNFICQRLSKAVILAGGEGVLEESSGKKISKILLPYEGKMFIEHVFDWLAKYGIKDIVISAGNLSLEVKERIGDGSRFGAQVSYLPKDVGTASVLKYLTSIIDETFLMMNGDVLSVADLGDMYSFHKKAGGICTIGMTSIKDPSSFGTIKMNGSQIIDFVEKPEKGTEESYLINAGVYIMEPEIFRMTSTNYTSLEKNFFPFLAKEGKLFGYYLQEKWIHLGGNEITPIVQ
jgi:NDP-sugar pyrophosphorylase family protein